MLNLELKQGMWVVCLPGYNTGDNGKLKGGGGYKENYIFQATHIDGYDTESIAWGGRNGNGVYARALRPATEWEIKHKQVQKEMNYEIY